ncbi:sensor histidine kinase [Pseudofulvibacter geojedonensis]|uniref:histidine kinase n=1 Tax=Pseudofulvibacter geojedonensis TaxID=1123758 RepID=A0ABW3HYZ2_9FLAO
MNKKIFIALVVLMSLSLIGIIFVQSYWINASVEDKEEQFSLQVNQILGTVSKKIEKQERVKYSHQLQMLIDSLGQLPSQTVITEMFLVQKDAEANAAFLVRSGVVEQNYNVTTAAKFLDIPEGENINLTSFVGKSETTFFDELGLDESQFTLQEQIERVNQLPQFSQIELEKVYKKVAKKKPIHKRLTNKQIELLLANEFNHQKLDLDYEYAVYSKGLATSVHSEDYELLKNREYDYPLFEGDGDSKFQLRITFPNKKKYLLSSILSMASLSFIFTIIIVLAYAGALYQLIKQRQISQIKTDFINNMTHEFKTPIATINLALDAIKNPKVLSDDEKVKRYLGMIGDENKRMHAQVENVLRISKLEKKQLDIEKEHLDVHDLIEDAIPHIELLVEDRGGYVKTHLNAKETSILANEIHFTNILVNVLDNAIKYSPEAPEIDVYTENVKNFVLLKIKDKGSGMTKSVQKKIFEKFYREHTGNIHNVKGHGLGLAYVKQIVDDHQGDIYVESERGKGSTFIIKIPLIS